MFMTPGKSGSRTTTRTVEMKAKPKGLGDVVAAVLGKIGIKKRKGCGCEKRQNLLNKIFPL